MALTSSRECGAQVSTEADTCPHCGIRAPDTKPRAPVKDHDLAIRGRYIEKVLQPGERVVCSTTIHWVVYVPGFGLLIVALWLAFNELVSGRPPWGFIWCATAGGILLLTAWAARSNTEIDVTDKRVILKYWFMSYRTVEMNVDKMISVDVRQSPLGQIFDYGTITINGAGGYNFDPLPLIGSPLEFRNHIVAR